jgi:hypothetical protein
LVISFPFLNPTATGFFERNPSRKYLFLFPGPGFTTGTAITGTRGLVSCLAGSRAISVKHTPSLFETHLQPIIL